MNKRYFLLLFLGSILHTAGSRAGVIPPLFESSEYSIYADKVTQGEYAAVALSDKEITSDYQSPSNQSYSPIITFRFSINEKDDELPAGENHQLLIMPVNGYYESPIIKFGEPFPLPVHALIYQELPSDTKVKIRLDMRSVLKSFADSGYYCDARGEKIAKDEFKGVYIAGGSSPLSWDFENLRNKDMQLLDLDGDSIYTIEKIFNAYYEENFTASDWKLSKDISNYPQQQSPYMLLDALYNMTLEEVIQNSETDGTFRTGKEWDGVWTRDISYSVILGLAAIEPERCKTSLLKKVNRRRIIQDTGSGGAWPVSTDRIVWALAAWELYCVTGDNDWLQEAYEIISNTLNDDMQIIFSPEGLVMGESSFLDWRKQSYPLWMNNVDIFRSENLSTNAVHYAAYQIASKMASILGNDIAASKYEGIAVNLQKSVNQYLWVPSKNYYGQYRYGREYMVLSENPEILGESLAVLYGIAPQETQTDIIKNTPMLIWGSPCFYPQIPNIPPYHNDAVWPFVQGFWNLAAAQAGNGKALEQGLAAFYRAAALFLTNKENLVAENGDFKTVLNSDRQLWSVAASLGMSYKIFFGMSFQPDFIAFNPSVPLNYGGERTLSNFKYRDALLDIKVSGYGNQIKSFKIDGKKSTLFEVPASLKGKHMVEIILMNNDFSSDEQINLVENKFAPQTPNTRHLTGTNTITWRPAENAVYYDVYVNGDKQDRITDTELNIQPSDKPVSVSIRSVASDGTGSFLSEPIFIVPAEAVQIVEAEEFAAASSRSVINASGSGAVEISRAQNKKLELRAEVEEEGEYFIYLRYSNGFGLWNTDNKCANRTLFVNDKKEGVMVFAQRGKDEWSNWGYSNVQTVHLHKGENIFRLELRPENTNMNVDINTALIDNLIIIKK